MKFRYHCNSRASKDVLAEEKQRFPRQATALQRAAEILQVAAAKVSTLCPNMATRKNKFCQGTVELQSGCVVRPGVS